MHRDPWLQTVRLFLQPGQNIFVLINDYKCVQDIVKN